MSTIGSASGESALPRGSDPVRLSRVLLAAHDRFVSTGGAGPTDSAVRRVVADSWLRSVASGVDPEVAQAAIRTAESELRDIRSAHPLTRVMPVIRRLLVDDAADAGLLVAVSDAAGQLLYVEGSDALRSVAEHMHFVPGSDWSEASIGTNAPGTALALGRPVQILGPEHLARTVTPWSCSAAPIRDPDTGAILGVLDVTGGVEVASRHALQMVRATAAAAEAELRINRMSEAGRPTTGARAVPVGWDAPRLRVLGRAGAVLTHGSTTVQLSPRHSEMLFLLTGRTDGMTAAELAVALSEEDQSPVTIRVEVSRLRRLLGPVHVTSRPYHLSEPLETDHATVRRHLAAGELRRAVAAYAGPVLPGSRAPGVVALRDDLHAAVRSTLVASADADALLGFADTPHGRDDYVVWERALAVLPESSPRRPQVQAHLEILDRELG